MTTLLLGDCRDMMAGMDAESVDSIVTDPPYGLSKDPDIVEVLTHWMAGDDYKHRGGGFMGKTWDSFVPGPAVWREAYRVLKPGGHMLVFAGTRTVDLMGISLRMAGFEIRDTIQWLYGSGFPKSMNVGKAIDKAAGAEREVTGRQKATGNARGKGAAGHYANGLTGVNGYEVVKDGWDVTAPATPEAQQWDGWGTALKPANEPIILARKPLGEKTVAKNVLAHGTGALNIDGCRVEGEPWNAHRATGLASVKYFTSGDAKEIDKQPHANGRWPANVILDEEAAAMLDAQSGVSKSTGGRTIKRSGGGNVGSGKASEKAWSNDDPGFGDTGGASRFFYVAKASRKERNAGLEGMPEKRSEYRPNDPDENSIRTRLHGSRAAQNPHPTVKPIRLMQYLVRLVTPPGGVVLDPFMGSGTTGCASALEGVQFIGIEMSDEYMEIARLRIAHWASQPRQLTLSSQL